MGYSVVAVATYEEALAQAKKNRFDLYLLDHQLADGTGRELRDELKEISPDTPALYCTATLYSSDAIHEARLSGDDFLLKPVEPENLKSAIAALLVARP
jgi:CheY-like chemotaxis protein